MRRFAAISLVMVLTACSGAKHGPVALSPDAYEMPVSNEKLQPAPGKDPQDLLMEVIVPPRPDGKPTKLQFYKQPQGLFAAKGAARTSLVSDNPQAQASQPARWPWWWKALGILAGLGAGWLVWLKISGPVKVFFGGAWALVRRLFK